MAIAATPITQGKNLLDLLRQTVPPQERAIELYRRLLAINNLSGLMGSAKSVDQLHDFLGEYFQECFHDEQTRLCIVEGSHYRRLCLSGAPVPKLENYVPITHGMAGSVLKSGTRLWIPDTKASDKKGKLFRANTESLPRSILIIPFWARGKVIGCLEMTSNRPDRLDEIEYHLGTIVATHLSASLDNILTRQELASANARLKDHDQRLSQLNEKLKQLAHTDESTGLYNKRRLLEQLDMEIARARRYGEVFSCFMIDIDDFKSINDRYGHQAGDDVLKQTGKLLCQSLRKSDFIARYGGEEFTVLLPRTNGAGAYRAAENLRSNFMSHAFTLPSAKVRITISIGITSCTIFDRLDARRIIRRADDALYRAKRSGKNRVCFNDENESSEEKVRILSNA
ncbi:MAG: GGDEF domain-containing protein [Acidobacteria bacterium]|nr:GGDEF domain-containing protein [Acidobacteriota bacterium]